MILITGGDSQLAYEYRYIFDKNNRKYICFNKEKLDIRDFYKLEKISLDYNVKMIINCAAYNNVDLAEKEIEKAYDINSKAILNLVLISKKINAVLVTYSTDFVFDGLKKTPYTENDITNPINIYGKTKLEGENIALSYDKSFVIRTSWLYGNGNNFNKNIINWIKNMKEINIVNDQISTPTYAYDLAEYTLRLIESKKYGLYHITNRGECSKYEQALYLIEKLNKKIKINPVSTSYFDLPAKRPLYTKLCCEKAEKYIGNMPKWEDAMERYIFFLKNKGFL